MNRRDFIELASVAALASIDYAHADVRSQTTGPVPKRSQAMHEPATAQGIPDYFTRDRLASILDISSRVEDIRFETVAYNFPNYHPSHAQERFFGKDWTEWQILARTKPYFKGQLQPKYPFWGDYNEAEPEWAEREIEAASQHGIDTFMIDWYWYSGTQLLQEQLEDGFLKAGNRDKMKFAIMWANLDWRNQYPAPDSAGNDYNKCPVLYEQTYSDRDMDNVVEYWIEHYFHQPNYWKISGIPVIGIFDVEHMLKAFGPDKLRKTLDGMRNRAAKAGTGGIHMQASHVYTPGKTPLKECGFDSATKYHTAGGAPGEQTEFVDAAVKTIELWKSACVKIDLPYFPDCPVGWDNSSRYGEAAHVWTHRTPDQYEVLLLGAKHFLAKQGTKPAIVYLSSWNEWTEDHILAPDNYYGYGYLEAVRHQFPRLTR